MRVVHADESLGGIGVRTRAVFVGSGTMEVAAAGSPGSGIFT